MTIRIGQGCDVHAFGPGQQLVLGGVCIPFHCSLVAHSDGDVLIHALIDALLGALALGDIGSHFPDSDEKYKGCDSRQLLRHTVYLLAEQGYCLGNADITLIAEAPKMAPHISAMRRNLSDDMNCQMGRVSVKATTTEKLGFCGRGEGIAATAVVLLNRLDSQ